MLAGNSMGRSISETETVAVLLSTYNGENFLQPQLDSLYAQTYSNTRIVVRDDGSSDSTREILGAERSLGRIELLEADRNLGPALSFFELLRHAGRAQEYVAFCDQDDIWLPDKMRHAVSALEAVPADQPAIYCSRLEIVDEQLNHLGLTAMPRQCGFGNALVENVAVGCTMVLNRKAAELVLENLPSKVYIHDWWCYLVISCFGKVIYGPSPDIRYRQHGGNTIGIAKDIFGQFKRKFDRFFAQGRRELWCSDQAQVFKEIFDDRLPARQKRILEKFVAARSSYVGRLRLAMSREVWRQKPLDNLILRLLILLGRI
jgi:glycosyltransferase involved in cell wall biosynthesis